MKKVFIANYVLADILHKDITGNLRLFSADIQRKEFTEMRKPGKLKFSLVALLLAALTCFSACTGGGTEDESDSGHSTTGTGESDTGDREQTSGTEQESGTGDGEGNIKEEFVVASKKIVDFKTTAQANVSGSTAQVTTAEGLKYTAENFSEFADGRFAFDDTLTVTFENGQFDGEFNRFILCYVSDSPLKCVMTYTQDGKEKTDSFFIEAGTQNFNCLITDYLKNKKAVNIDSITFETYGEKASFILCNLISEVYELYTDDTYYIENDKFKVGIRLTWGGGISYIEDKENTISGLANLVNQADTGRLIQQSYYGTGETDEYKPGNFNNSKWSYNPVQGGDQYQNHSRIIDVVVENYSVYIKAQPQDWSLDNQITPSYMENCYTIYEDYIRVDNRFVDFSGWTHPFSSQEVPAFYTVSYLDKFTLYNGSDSWTDDELFSRDDLNFWGDPQYAADCTFYVRNSNTETWCSWTSSKDDYGIGLYVPNVDSYSAGRHMYNGSKDPKNGACNYVAPVNIKQMVSFEPIEYSYLITTGSVDEIREIFKTNRDFAGNEDLHENYISRRVPDADIDMSNIDLTKEENVQAVSPANNTSMEFDSSEGALKVIADVGSDVQLNINYSAMTEKLKAEDFSKITIEYMIPSSNSGNSYTCELFLCTGDVTGATAGMSVRGNYQADGQYHTLEISLDNLEFWSGDINQIRYDYFDACSDGDVIYLKSIVLS